MQFPSPSQNHPQNNCYAQPPPVGHSFNATGTLNATSHRKPSPLLLEPSQERISFYHNMPNSATFNYAEYAALSPTSTMLMGMLQDNDVFTKPTNEQNNTASFHLPSPSTLGLPLLSRTENDYDFTNNCTESTYGLPHVYPWDIEKFAPFALSNHSSFKHEKLCLNTLNSIHRVEPLDNVKSVDTSSQNTACTNNIRILPCLEQELACARTALPMLSIQSPIKRSTRKLVDADMGRTNFEHTDSYSMSSSDVEEPQEVTCAWKDCGKVFVSLDLLVSHLNAEHIGSKKSSYSCLWEGCERNGRPFSKRHKVSTHLRTHTGERPFACSATDCGKRFSRLDSLVIHLRTHSTNRPYYCPVYGCGKSFCHPRSLRKHEQGHSSQKRLLHSLTSKGEKVVKSVKSSTCIVSDTMKDKTSYFDQSLTSNANVYSPLSPTMTMYHPSSEHLNKEYNWAGISMNSENTWIMPNQAIPMS